MDQTGTRDGRELTIRLPEDAINPRVLRGLEETCNAMGPPYRERVTNQIRDQLADLPSAAVGGAFNAGGVGDPHQTQAASSR
jgi:hypothetical protein